jgi:protein O-mannosyl-transferase
VTFCVYARTTGNGFVGIDDDLFVVNNAHVQQGLSWEGIKWALTEHATDYWHPLPWMSHMLDVSLFGKWAGGHHLSSLLLHIANTLLLFGFLRYATRRLWASAFVAGLFALHPLHVESVAWAAERKDVLSTLFFFATLWAYARYARNSKLNTHNSKLKWYCFVIILYALGLASKPMLVMVPVVMLLMDYWPLERVRFEKGVRPRESGSPEAHRISQEKGSDSVFGNLGPLILEKVPLFAMAAIVGVLTIISQQKVTAVVSLDEVDVSSRLTNAIVSYWRYVQEMFWPAGLAVYYPMAFKPLYAQAAAAAAFLIIVTGVVLYFGRRFRYLPVGWLWYLAILLPVIGILQSGHQAHADRYTYVPLVGLFIIMAFGIGDAIAARPRLLRIAWVAGAVCLAACSALTFRTIGYWKDDLTLYTRAVSVTKDNYFMLTSMAAALGNRGEIDKALECAAKAVALRPSFGRAQVMMGTLLQEKGQVEEALAYCRRGAELEPKAKDTQLNLALAYMRLGNAAEAEFYSRKALEIDPQWAQGYDLLGLVLATEGKFEEAEANLRKSLSLDPSNSDGYAKLALVLEKTGRKAEAIEELKKALAIDPANERIRQLLSAYQNQKD